MQQKGFLNLFTKKPSGQSETTSFGIETSKGIVYVSSTPQSSLTLQPQETAAEFKQRKSNEKAIGKLLDTKLEADINAADDLEYMKLFDRKDIIVQGSKELEVILEAVEFMKRLMMKKGFKADLSASMADKSELKEQRQKCKTLKKELEKIQFSNSEKAEKIKNLQSELKKLKASSERINNNNKKLLVENKALKKLVHQYKQKYEEQCKMQSHESTKLYNVFCNIMVGKYQPEG
eukprot:TRINITY_DN2582_c0_g1_i1.p2 TRINITY_DN2582_c0_g1~~TRINITY_DN2582_c0_g1_i1.p2  ORF type:complete len:234 (-),score=70.59 TRINITY_DN2582_c0_g1_i1:1112-1813(-)